MGAFKRWDHKNGHLKEEEQQWERTCTCFKHVKYPGQLHVWRGHVVTTEAAYFNSPTV